MKEHGLKKFGNKVHWNYLGLRKKIQYEDVENYKIMNVIIFTDHIMLFGLLN
jgi:hypothetical protein